jgi:hypothetical protein
MNSVAKERKKLAKEKAIQNAQQGPKKKVFTMGSNDVSGAVGNKAKQAQGTGLTIFKSAQDIIW